jgi:tetratricopeptide (TPR) repeat protein
MVLTAIMVRYHVGRTRQTAYAEQMQFAQASLDRRDYQAAMDAFDAALKLRPDDSDAQQGLRYARRRLESTRSAGMAVPRPQQSAAEIVPSAGPNPFMPVPIGPSIREQPQPQQTRQGPRPPLVDWGHDVVGNRGSSTTREEVVFEQGPLEEPAEEETPRPRPSEAAEEPPPAPEEPPGEISIWVSEPPPPSQETTPGPGHTGVAPSEDATRAMSLRERADALRQQGRCQEAAGLYAEAVEAYRADSEANPRARSLNDAAVQACEHARSLCEASQG